jgi:hypothetical protein
LKQWAVVLDCPITLACTEEKIAGELRYPLIGARISYKYASALRASFHGRWFFATKLGSASLIEYWPPNANQHQKGISIDKMNKLSAVRDSLRDRFLKPQLREVYVKEIEDPSTDGESNISIPKNAQAGELDLEESAAGGLGRHLGVFSTTFLM